MHYASLPPEDIVLNPPLPEPERTLKSVALVPPGETPAIPPATAIDPAALAAFDWSRVKDSESIAVLERFIAKHPDTLHAELATERIAALRPPPDPGPVPAEPDATPDPPQDPAPDLADSSPDSLDALQRLRSCAGAGSRPAGLVRDAADVALQTVLHGWGRLDRPGTSRWSPIRSDEKGAGR